MSMKIAKISVSVATPIRGLITKKRPRRMPSTDKAPMPLDPMRAYGGPGGEGFSGHDRSIFPTISLTLASRDNKLGQPSPKIVHLGEAPDLDSVASYLGRSFGKGANTIMPTTMKEGFFFCSVGILLLVVSGCGAGGGGEGESGASH